MRDLPAALLIDMDGTVVDTEPYWMASEMALVAEFGGTWTDDDAHSIVGFDLLDSAEQLRVRGGVDLAPHAIVERLLDSVIERCRVELPWRPGARELLLDAGRREVPAVLVTMSWRRLAGAVLDAAPPGVFAGSVTGDEVDRGKPHPEPYLRAAASLGVEPATCLAIEDSPTGIAAAVSAGCATVAVPHMVPVDDEAGRVVVETLVGTDVAGLWRVAEGARRQDPAAS
ncbi:MAG: HAD family phosphatase [Actinomycetota bacterium]